MKEAKVATLLVRSSTSVLDLERHDLDQRTSFSHASLTALRRSRVGSFSGFVAGPGCTEGVAEGGAFAAREGGWQRRGRNVSFEGKV